MRAVLSLVLLASVLPACRPEGSEGPPKDVADTDTDTDTDAEVDDDGDGHAASVDCDDTDDSVFPGAAERCDGVDQDCDGAVDEEAVDRGTFHTDADGDGHGDPATAVTACEAGTDQVADGTDCDDADPAVHPDAPEPDCTDPVDYNCDGSTGYADADGDGAPACGDCDDTEAGRSPLLAEACDPDDVDEDCDGAADDADDDATGTTTWHPDADGDGYAGDGAPLALCDAPLGYAAATGDCDDLDPAANPGATEVCDAADTDEDCDGASDDADPSTEEGTRTTWYADRDADGFGDAAVPVTGCEAPPDHVPDATDCDDRAPGVHPGATEVCDADRTDEDCDGASEDADPGVVGQATWYADADGDGHGDPAAPAEACELPAGHVTTATDCDDRAAGVHPDAAEACDAADTDEDCDGLADDADADASGQTVWFRDTDGDGYAGAARALACDAPPDHHATATDCDDAAASVHPGAIEVCDAANVDEDCDRLADDHDTDAAGKATWYRDADGDGHAGATAAAMCDAPSGWLASATDCDDASAAVSPDAAEVCDAADVDEDCDGLADDRDGAVAGERAWHRDADADGYGDPSVTADACDAPGGYVADATDCDDADRAVSPAGTEVCDAADADEDCDGLADDADADVVGRARTWLDADADGYGDASVSALTCDAPEHHVANDDDCDDGDDWISPAAAEVCDDAATDEDCDGLADDADPGVTGTRTLYVDADLDGFGATPVARCEDGPGYSEDATDCDDRAIGVHPDAEETCGDGVDQDCAGGDEACPVPRYAGTYDPEDAYVTKLSGEVVYDEVGEALVGGDFDGDGVGDLLVGASGYDHPSARYTGAVFGYQGPFLAGARSVSASDDVVYYNNQISYTGIYGRDAFNLGDLDLDGGDDLAILAGSSTVLVHAGGETGDLAHDATDLTWASCWSAAPGGDFDPTVTGEWVCGYANHNADRGAVWVYAGGTTLVEIQGTVANGFFGNAVAGGADIDGDGVDDLWAGAYQADHGFADSGAAFLYSGPLTGTISDHDADVTVAGDGAYHQLGARVASPGDLDGDGAADLMASAPGHSGGATGGGAVYLFTAGTGGAAATVDQATILGAGLSDRLQVFTTGDFDGDGVLDVLVGTSNHDAGGSNAGGAWLLYGPLAGTYYVRTDADATWLGDSVDDELGYALAAIPDTDGDGDDEIAMGGRYAEDGTRTDRGAVWIWPGR